MNKINQLKYLKYKKINICYYILFHKKILLIKLIISLNLNKQIQNLKK